MKALALAAVLASALMAAATVAWIVSHGRREFPMARYAEGGSVPVDPYPPLSNGTSLVKHGSGSWPYTSVATNAPPAWWSSELGSASARATGLG